MTRAQLLYSTQDQLYRVIDTEYNCLVLLTSSYTVANYWRQRVNSCKHPIPYDIIAHDPRVTDLIKQLRH